MGTNNDYRLKPSFGDSFGTGWRVMGDNFLRLFLVVLVVGILTGPTKMFHMNFSSSDFPHFPWIWHGHMGHEFFNLASLGLLAGFFILLALLYSFLVVPVIKYGSKMIFIQAVRKIKPDFEWLLKGFWENYLNIILANLLVVALVILGFIALIIPGIIIGCRLAFVSYLVMDKKLDPIEAVEQSWKLTRGHGWTIFFMGFVSIFIVIFGLILMIVGVFPATMWISSSFASLYQAVLNEKEKPAELIAAQA
ncbi:MAG: hypothetical protein ABSA76_03370 [Bacteroidales bacterium]